MDTANIHSGSASEEMAGRPFADPAMRDRIVLATAFGFDAQLGNPDGGACGAKNGRRALEGSLRRLGTDQVDPCWMLVWDGVTPVDEIVQTTADLVCAA